MTTAKRAKAQQIPALEWIAGGVGLLIVAGTLAFIGYEIYLGERDLPDLRVVVERAIPRNGGHSVRVVVRNIGRHPAQTVIIEGVAGNVRSEAQVDYVAGQSSAAAILVFPQAPDPATLRVRVVGYAMP